MDDIDVSESMVQDDDKNEFLDGQFQYQNCPHCQRNFFFGKLKYHLKLCKPNNPMTKSPLKKTKRSIISTALEKSQSQIDNLQIQSPTSFRSPQKYKKCQFCRSTFPIFMLEKHIEKCNSKPNTQSNPQDSNKLKSRTKIDFGIKKDLKEPSSALPRITNSAKQNKNIQRKFVSQDAKDLKAEYTVRIREDLSCFKKALEVQQIQCQYCHRKFSKQASMRHIPICQKIKLQEMHQLALKKHSKSEIYKLNVPLKKSNLFRSKFLGNLSQKNQDLQIKSARFYQIEKLEREKITNSSLVIKKEEKNEKRLSDLKPLITKDAEVFRNQYLPSQQMIKNISKQKSSLQLNMTFSKMIHDLSQKNNRTVDVPLKKNDSERLPTFQKEEGMSYFEDNSFPSMKQASQFQKEPNEQVQNEFLQVTVSKRKFFAQIVLDQKSNIFEKKEELNQKSQEQNDRRKIMLEIQLKDFNKKKEENQQHLMSVQAKKYKMDLNEF